MQEYLNRRWEVNRYLKSREDTKFIPIIALTAHATSDDQKTSFDAGCDDFDTKPVRLQGLLAKINHLL